MRRNIKQEILCIVVLLSLLVSYVNASKNDWDVAVRFDIANFNDFYPFSKTPGKVGKTYYANLTKSDYMLELIPYCSTGCGLNCYWAQLCRKGCNEKTCKNDEISACQCSDLSHCYKPKAWYVERRKISDGKFNILIRGISKADCGLGQGYVKGELWINTDKGWKITHVEKCQVSKDTRGREYYCVVNNVTGRVRFASGSSCIGCCACEDSAFLNINITLESNFSDISIDEISFSNENPSKGENVTIIVKISNKGKNLSDVLIRFYIGNPSRKGKLIDERRINLEENSSATVATSFIAMESEDIYVVVDPKNEIIESNEENNILRKTIKLKGPDYMLYLLLLEVFILFLLLGVIIFLVYKSLSYKAPKGEKVISCERCGMILAKETKECPVCGNRIC